MTTRELYIAIGVSGYELQGCWREDGAFHIRMEGPQLSHKCPKCGNWEVIHRGTYDRCKATIRSAVQRQLEVPDSGELEAVRRGTEVSREAGNSG